MVSWSMRDEFGETLRSWPVTVPQRLISASLALRNDLKGALDRLSGRLQQLNQELYSIFQVYPGMPKFEIPCGFEKSDVHELQQIQHILLQHEIYLKYIINFLEEYSSMVQELVASFAVTVEELNQVIGIREAIPTSEVYDRFINVAESFMNIQAENTYLLSVNSVVKTLASIDNKYMIPTKLEVAISMSEREPWVVDRWEMEKKIPLDADIPGVTQLNLTDETVLQFRGYCVWTLIATNGLLVPARTELGILKFGNNYYGFCTSDAADAWRYNAELNTRLAYEVVRTNAEMVDLLEMFDILSEYRTEILVKESEQNEVKVQSECVQTVTHPVLTRIDRLYTFSEWQLKERALQLSRLIKCQTKSVQTIAHSNFRASIGIQCSPDKSKETNTMKDAACVHERPLNYQWGLRGSRNFQNLTLTQSIGESYYRILPSGNKPCLEQFCP
ncbi:UNVERIFIED_CONTAM: hypothetical protein PYX00_007487 [Menopon gallinae]|uniref:Cilia- and flagella-associated protein 206 n=1 Tax=Menopon gallinae TaxID=328185 RepID=A0AAW2HKD0_9NEOP